MPQAMIHLDDPHLVDRRTICNERPCFVGGKNHLWRSAGRLERQPIELHRLSGPIVSVTEHVVEIEPGVGKEITANRLVTRQMSSKTAWMFSTCSSTSRQSTQSNDSLRTGISSRSRSTTVDALAEPDTAINGLRRQVRLQMAGISADIEDPPLKNGPVLEPDTRRFVLRSVYRKSV